MSHIVTVIEIFKILVKVKKNYLQQLRILYVCLYKMHQNTYSICHLVFVPNM